MLHYDRMSDFQRGLEYRTKLRFASAVEELRSALQDIATGSELVEVDMKAFELFVADDLPSVKHWEEKLMDQS